MKSILILNIEPIRKAILRGRAIITIIRAHNEIVQQELYKFFLHFQLKNTIIGAKYASVTLIFRIFRNISNVFSMQRRALLSR